MNADQPTPVSPSSARRCSDTGRIVPIGAWVLRQALATAAQWQHALPGNRPPCLSVNVSARQFRLPDFVDTVRHALAGSGLPTPPCCWRSPRVSC
jgi:EAL domain-containing protein (putative c-di-GMP-specific phosphodiesterase class I)